MTLQTTRRAVSAIEAPNRFLDDVLEGLAADPKTLPSKHFYDERGSELFERICALDAYYLTETELAIMRRHVDDMAGAIGPRALLIEPGSGASLKVRLLLRHLEAPAGYVPVDISGDHLTRWAHLLHEEVPSVPILPVHADFAAPFAVPDVPDVRRRVIYFPGSTIGNLVPDDARAWLARMAGLAGPGGGLLIGADRRKDAAILEAAYDDAAGVTAAFNRNLLVRLRDELGADVDPDAFAHRAVWNDAEGRIEMHLVSRGRQSITIDGHVFDFADGESIHTENSYKHDVEAFRALLRAAGWTPTAHWTDERDWFSVHWCVVAA